MLSINPYIPQSWGTLLKLGDTPRPPCMKYPTALSQQFLYVHYAIDYFIPRQIRVLAMTVLFQIVNSAVSYYLFFSLNYFTVTKMIDTQPTHRHLCLRARS